MKIVNLFVSRLGPTGHVLVLMFLSLVFLKNTGCREDIEKVDKGPSAITSGIAFEAEQILKQESIDSLIPDWSDAHTAWRVEWEGARAARVVVERYRRRECFIKASYGYAGDGEYRKTSLEVISNTDGNDASIEDLILTSLLQKISRGSQGLFHRQDSFGRLVWSFFRESAKDDINVSPEIMGRVTYEDQPCILPPVMMSRNVPAKQIPAQ